MKTHVKMAIDEIDLDKELESVFCWGGGSKEWCMGILGFSATNGKYSEYVFKF